MIQKAVALILFCFIIESIAESKCIEDLLSIRKKVESLYGLDDLHIVKNELNKILFTGKSDSAFTEHFHTILDTCNTPEKIVLETIKAFDRYYYQPMLENFLSSENKKVLFFGTSVSCQCTLEMCDEFLQELLKHSNNYGAHYIYVDAFYNYKLMKEYDALFIPTAVVLDKRNSVISVIGDFDSLKEELTNLFKNDRE